MKLAAVGDNCMDVYDGTGEAYPGGNPVNVAVYFVRMGGEASYTGVVGTDKYGALMRESIAAKGVDVSTVRTEAGNTAITHVELVNGDRVLGDYEEGVLADFRLTDDQRKYLCRQKMVVTGLWGNVHNDLAKIRAAGALVAFDAATRPEDEAARIAIPATDYLFFSSDDGDTPELRAKMKEIHSRGPKVVVTTLGDQGSLAYDGEEYIGCGIVTCDVVDTMGAGDSYIAGFLKGILEEKTVPECMRMGAENASITLGYFGAW